MSTDKIASPELNFNSSSARRHRSIRALKDKVASGGIAIGGISVIVAILLIFFYLLYEVLPLFQSASIEPWQEQDTQVEAYALPGEGKTLYLTLEEQTKLGLRVTDQGQLVFFDTRTGKIRDEVDAELPEDTTITSFALASDSSGIFALGLSNGQALVYKHAYTSTYPNGVRVITPRIEYPLGEAPIAVSEGPLDVLALNGTEENWTLIGGTREQLYSAQLSLTENIITEEVETEVTTSILPSIGISATRLQLTPDRHWLMVAGPKNKLAVVELLGSKGALVNQVLEASKGDIAEFKLLLGGNSLLVADNQGTVSQWFLVRDESNAWQLTKIRSFNEHTNGITALALEHRRKGFVTLNQNGYIDFYNTTASRTSLSEQILQAGVEHAALSPRSDALLLEQGGKISLWKMHNEHPEVSWSALWEKVWYEGYEEPEFIWQSSASNNDFEPKYSLMPLAFGTLKAAFYAMLLATPLAICGAIYTAYFMVPAMRRKVKPFIELMEALPTVILGFLAGLWLAPFIEINLAGIFITLLVVPAAIIGFAFAWANAPKALRYMIPEGWDAALLVPVVIIATMFSFWIAPTLEHLFFGTEMRYWVTNELGIPYDQRNALVVGLAMGFAVIPTIFSITEDAIFAVPKHLSYGSLALGATPWQTLTRVVMPTASPGIFSAVMIGMGRAVGETMIVLMATGNTPIMDANIFEGMRTLAANIAVEMPESEVGSTHFRILFLAAFVLFLFTFFVNTIAEAVRQRLRKKYGSL
ncbi:ABC transporter permease subunit [Neptuniibacter sp. CAU 1671]|uniref:ABC transporter permease subunit n=1 Tax=Neptuniibacter sp. CAU 1671 TaxID=3032593 RepID=UPI0023DAE31A|nr:ABC transporter permease subunit [Neptuniibacter sp. CAU 1671]MDF2182991.1 ABC transporter permease subunit [Neptuniibacter sp. CAU 1671]